MIDDDVLGGRIPRLGTITTGRGVESTSKAGNAYSRPTKADTLVFHTDDPEVAYAVQLRFGGDLQTDSPSWDYDVVTDTRTADVLVLPEGFRQDLELWRAAECIRRCSGVTMRTRDGRPTAEPCLCEQEISQGQERACKPSTVLPVLVDLDVERFGVWEIRSTSWGTAHAIKGTISALRLVGATQGSVPAVLSMVDRQVRDASRQVRDIVELHLTIARSHRSLSELASRAAAAIDAPPLGELPAGDDADRLELMQAWSDLQSRAHRLGLREILADEWRSLFGSEPRREFADLTVDELRGWVDVVRSEVTSAEEMIRAESADARGSRVSDGDPGPAATPPADVPPVQGS